jgi:hypothetical protein
MLQFVKAELPAGEEKFDGQGMHVELGTCLSCVEYVPAPQSVQAAFPTTGLYFSAAQSEHGPPFGPVDPVLQVQLVKTELPAGELEDDGQTLHVEIAVAPTAVEYV